MSLLIRSESFCKLSELLPYNVSEKRDGQIVSALQEYQLLLTAIEHVVESIQQGNLEQFDALVGENMCQVRAVKIMMVLPMVITRIGELQGEARQIRGKIEILTPALTKSPRGSFQQVIENNSFEIQLHSNEAFLVKCYLLTCTKTVKASHGILRNEVADPKKLQRLGKVSGSFATALIRKLRHIVSSETVTFIQECAHRLPENFDVIPYLGEDAIVEHNGCHALPFFFTNVVLMRQLFAAHLPVVICAHQLVRNANDSEGQELRLLLIPTARGYERQISCAQKDLETLAFVIEGVMQRDRELLMPEEAVSLLLQHSVEDLVLFGSAAHRQSPNPEKEEQLRMQGGQKLQDYQDRAERYGCSYDNPSLFCINHVFCAALKHVLHMPTPLES